MPTPSLLPLVLSLSPFPSPSPPTPRMNLRRHIVEACDSLSPRFSLGGSARVAALSAVSGVPSVQRLRLGFCGGLAVESTRTL